MATRLFGVETEYALTALDRRGASVERQALLLECLQLARDRLVHLPDRTAAGIYLANAGRLYIDAGEHPEFSTPECTHPDDVVRYVRAGDRILAELAAALVERRGDLTEAIVLRSNVDYGGSHATWGSHESYLHRENPDRLPRQLIPHLVSRIVYTGAGGFNSFSGDAIEFTLSPRVWHLQSAISGQSTNSRGIFHTKDESLSSDGYHRLHIICGESLCSDSALWLRVGTTALVVALIEAGIKPGEAVQLSEPLAAMRRFASDPACRATAETEGGVPMTALAIQRHYLALARRHSGQERMPPWTADVCDRWGAMLDRLEGAPESVASHVDWAIKLALYRKHVERRGFEWGSFPQEDRVVHGLRIEPFDAQLSLPIKRTAGDGPPAGAVDPPAVAGHALCKRDPLDFVRLRGELFEIDMRFSQLGDKGIFAALERAGAISGRLVEPADVARALEEPPATGRAFMRGQAIRQLHARAAAYCCDWSGVWDRRSARVLDLSDPFAARPRWAKCQGEDAAMPMPPADRARALHDRAMALYREGRYEDALRFFRQAVRVAPDPAHSSAVAWSRFWAATVLHNMGRLREAGVLLDELARIHTGDDLLYMALTRRVVINVERPSPLREIESSLRVAERQMSALGHGDWRRAPCWRGPDCSRRGACTTTRWQPPSRDSSADEPSRTASRSRPTCEPCWCSACAPTASPTPRPASKSGPPGRRNTRDRRRSCSPAAARSWRAHAGRRTRRCNGSCGPTSSTKPTWTVRSAVWCTTQWCVPYSARETSPELERCSSRSGACAGPKSEPIGTGRDSSGPITSSPAPSAAPGCRSWIRRGSSASSRRRHPGSVSPLPRAGCVVRSDRTSGRRRKAAVSTRCSSAISAPARSPADRRWSNGQETKSSSCAAERLIELHPTYGDRRLWALLRFGEGLHLTRRTGRHGELIGDIGSVGADREGSAAASCTLARQAWPPSRGRYTTSRSHPASHAALPRGLACM